MKRHVEIAEDIHATSYDDEGGKSIVVGRWSNESKRTNLFQCDKDEAFKLAYALMSLASEL